MEFILKNGSTMEFILKNVTIEYTSINPFIPVECQIPEICGEVYNHPEFEDGSKVILGVIIARDGDKLIMNTGNKFILESIHPDYESMFPGSKERILKSIREIN